jgi:glucose-1-phosphate adenylyltransferase
MTLSSLGSARILAVVLSGGQGGRLGPLTTGRAKPSLPVGGSYRLIDVPLSNATHSGVTDVWVLQQYEPHLLNEHLAGGRPWDLDRTRGGLRILPPFEQRNETAIAHGNADALAWNWDVIEAFGPDALVVMSADQLFRFDLREALVDHLDGGNDATVVSTVMPRGEDVSRYLVVQADGDRVTDLAYKPDRPVGRRVGTELFVYRPEALGEVLRQLVAEGGDLGDYGDRLLPRLLDGGTIGNVTHDGYWRDLGTPESYLDTQLALLGDRPPLRLDVPDWPFLTSMPQRTPAQVHRGAEIDRSWLCPASDVRGRVVDSIIGPGTRVEAGAEVRHSVLMGDSVVRAGAVVARAVVAEEVVVGKHARVGAPNARRPVLIGPRRRIAAGAEIPAGTHLDAHRPRHLLQTTG